ncbi:hypothetical protein AJ80_01493 [Polytolypa hystricis UAMH7299]|uniref:DUF7730 domain-containing protein n=1 Tax=Polytolypa hystricis (strain UAMH7299) TaxID=1447883 RepID=A0A2B7Z0H1_POLH7|nr:hypothetical protein AJ80_01493 [Polytolypa hystricis UAMH7299]
MEPTTTHDNDKQGIRRQQLWRAWGKFRPDRKMANPLGRRNIAKASFDSDLSDAVASSTDRKNPGPPHHDSSEGSLSVSTTSNAEQKSTLLALPAEIRIQIYVLLLVSWFDPKSNPGFIVPNTRQKMVVVDMARAPEHRTMEPAILRTCKQVYHEAIPILYSRNVFNLSEPEKVLQFLAQIGPANIKFVRSLDIWVPLCADLLPWLELLKALSKKATGLRSIELAWDARPLMLQREDTKMSLGANVLFVRALAKIQGLEKLRISGFYAKHWPSYLKEEMDVQVQAEFGHHIPYTKSAGDEIVRRKWNERTLQGFRKFQEEAGDLIP